MVFFFSIIINLFICKFKSQTSENRETNKEKKNWQLVLRDV